MIVYSLLLGLAQLPPLQGAIDAWADAYKNQPGEAPSPIAVKAVSVERTITEFMDICFRTKWNIADIKKAVARSEFRYSVQHVNDNPNSFVWSSKNDYLVVELDPMFSQCALSIASEQWRTGEQLLDILRPAIEAELQREVQENDKAIYLQWTDPASGYVERITLQGASNQPQQAIWYLFDRTAPGVREKLDSMYPPNEGSRND